MLMNQNDYKGVDGALSRLNRVSSDCRPARLLAARMYLQEGNYEKCSWETGRLLKTEPGNVQALLLRGDSFYHLEVWFRAALSLKHTCQEGLMCCSHVHEQNFMSQVCVDCARANVLVRFQLCSCSGF